MYVRGCQKFGIKVYWRLVSRVFEDLKFKISEGSDQNWSCPETANRADSGQLQFWSEPSEILNVRSSRTPETVAFTIPWYQTWWNPYCRYLSLNRLRMLIRILFSIFKQGILDIFKSFFIVDSHLHTFKICGVNQNLEKKNCEIYSTWFQNKSSLKSSKNEPMRSSWIKSPSMKNNLKNIK